MLCGASRMLSRGSQRKYEERNAGNADVHPGIDNAGCRSQVNAGKVICLLAVFRGDSRCLYSFEKTREA